MCTRACLRPLLNVLLVDVLGDELDLEGCDVRSVSVRLEIFKGGGGLHYLRIQWTVYH